MEEAIDLANNAVDVMTHHGSDAKVQRMCKYILGEEDFASKFNQAKGKYLGYQQGSSDHKA